jgi:D-alanine-D-alanine ligase
MKLCILHSSYEGSAAPFKNYDGQLQLAPFLGGHTWEQHALLKSTAAKQIRSLARQGFDVFLNFCDGAWDEDRAGNEVVQTLERLNLPFTGAASAFYEPTRELMKRACHYSGIPTPNGIFVETVDEIEQVARLQFPLIVKHPNSYASIGIRKASRVTTLPELREQVGKMVAQYDGALIEEFIDGREFDVLVVENADDPAHPHVYHPAEFLFPAGESFKHFDLKWIDYRKMRCVSCGDPELAERLKDVSGRFFAALDGTGYGRCDLRVNAAGKIFMLEINPNCGVFTDEPGSADLILMQHPGGHADFLERLLRAALRRRRVKKWKLGFNDRSQYGLYAACAIAPGEILETYEEQEHILVSRDYVLAHWDADQQTTFAQYAYPITDETWVTWSADPAQWKPINHSCDPNAWLDGLNMVARRAILPNEQITLDYAMFMNELMPDFECHCQAPNCRGIVRGSDYMQPFVAKYGRHVSDYVWAKRAERAGSSVGSPLRTLIKKDPNALRYSGL